MKITTLKLSVSGDNYEDLCQQAELEIAKFLGYAESDEISNSGIANPIELPKSLNYELVVVQNENSNINRNAYSAEVIVRLKDAP